MPGIMSWYCHSAGRCIFWEMAISCIVKMKLIQPAFFRSKQTMETPYLRVKTLKSTAEPEWHLWCRFGVWIVTFEQISYKSDVSVVGFEEVNASWDCLSVFEIRIKGNVCQSCWNLAFIKLMFLKDCCPA